MKDKVGSLIHYVRSSGDNHEYYEYIDALKK